LKRARNTILVARRSQKLLAADGKPGAVAAAPAVNQGQRNR
jgi:hypothetical protein